MAHRIVAVDVGVGDAFFLQRGEFTALIDGGKACGFPRRLQRATGLDAVNVLVCTHNDCDHANGVFEFLDQGGRADECWLPATWLDAIYRIHSATAEELRELMLEKTAEDPPTPSREGGAEIDAGTVEELVARIAESDEWPHPRWDPNAPWFLLPPGVWVPRQFPATRRAISPLFNDAFNLLRIAVAASKLQIPIRWFDPEQPAASPPSAPLSVVSAQEVRAIRGAQLSLKGVVELTRVNRDSLVLYSPRDEIAPAVLFSADSGFENVAAPPADSGMVVTAPHHGAADAKNVAVYRKLDELCATHDPDTWLWLRSDLDCPARPCKAFLKRTIRYCTRCRGQGLKQLSQDVTIVGEGGYWHARARACNCQ